MQSCPKCHYVRKPTDTAPEWQCPSCGIAYAKFGAVPDGHARNIESESRSNLRSRNEKHPQNHNVSETLKGEADGTIEEYQRRRREFQTRFLKTVVLGGFPLIALVLIDGGEIKLVNGPLWHWIVVGLFFIAFARSIYLLYRYVRCPECDTIQFEFGGLQLPYHVCTECGARLSYGAKDST